MASLEDQILVLGIRRSRESFDVLDNFLLSGVLIGFRQTAHTNVGNFFM